MAFIITVALLKGGVGKTTTAVALAETAALLGPAVLIDADSMGSARRWYELAGRDGVPMGARLVGTDTAALDRHPASLADLIADHARRAEVVVVDAPPPGRNRVTEVAVGQSEELVIPTTPSLQDLDRVPATLLIATERDRRAAVVLTMVRAGLPERDEAREHLARFAADVLTTELPLTVSVPRAYGFPVTGVLARYGLDLLNELYERKAAADADTETTG